MTILKVTYGNPVASIKGICEHYQISDRTARMIVKELEQERGRYGDYTVLGDGALKRVNFLAFTDYWQFRKMLQDKNARKHVPVYSPQKVARSLGFYGGETYDGSGNPSGGICWDVCGSAARTRAIQRPYTCYADAFGRSGGMEEDLYNG